jgi:hypothetical protein
MPKNIHQNSFRERRVVVDRRLRAWPIKDYESGAVVGRVELSHDDRFQAIKTSGEVVGRFPSLSAARQALLPQVKRAKTPL